MVSKVFGCALIDVSNIQMRRKPIRMSPWVMWVIFEWIEAYPDVLCEFLWVISWYGGVASGYEWSISRYGIEISEYGDEFWEVLSMLRILVITLSSKLWFRWFKMISCNTPNFSGVLYIRILGIYFSFSHHDYQYTTYNSQKSQYRWFH